MQLKKLATFSIFCALAQANAAAAQYYVPVAPDERAIGGAAVRLNNADIRLDGSRVARIAAEREEELLPSDLSEVSTECAQKPTLNDVVRSGFEMRQSLISRAGAINLGLPVVNLSATGDELVYVRDYVRSVECLATDGRTRLTYGQAIRTVITISNASGTTDLTLPAIAANATLTSRRNGMRIQVIGFSNPEMTTTAASFGDKELNVETYREYMDVHNRLVQLSTAAATQGSVQRLGVIPQQQPEDVAEAVMAAWALQQISDGRSCEQAKARLPNLPESEPQPNRDAIDAAFIAITGRCSADAPNAVQRAQARSYLYGLKVGR